MAANAVRAEWENLRSLAFGGISANYALVGTPLQDSTRMLKLTNLTDAALLISFDGVSDKDVIAAGSAWIYDITSNRTDLGGDFEIPAFRSIYVKQESSAATSGTLYVTVIYGATQ